MSYLHQLSVKFISSDNSFPDIIQGMIMHFEIFPKKNPFKYTEEKWKSVAKNKSAKSRYRIPIFFTISNSNFNFISSNFNQKMEEKTLAMKKGKQFLGCSHTQNWKDIMKWNYRYNLSITVSDIRTFRKSVMTKNKWRKWRWISQDYVT